jgi:hypothetical protein
VARDAYWDFRVSDSYPQRSAFLLAAGQPELVKKRWIERILDRQNPDGSWNYCWYGWCRGVFEFSLTQDPDPGPHHRAGCLGAVHVEVSLLGLDHPEFKVMGTIQGRHRCFSFAGVEYYARTNATRKPQTCRRRETL